VAAAAAAGALVGGWSSDDESSAAQPSDVGSAESRYASELTAELGDLAKARSAGLAQLRKATGSAPQAEAAGTLAQAHVAAADRVEVLGAPAAVADEAAGLVRALDASGARYLRLADAADREDVRAYEREQGAIRRAEAESRRAVAATLSAAGASD
jgi:hypothetical protein